MRREKLILVLAAALAAGFFLLRWPGGQDIAPDPAAAIGATTATPASRSVPHSPTGLSPITAERDLDIVTLLPRDAIPAIDHPRFYSAGEADAEYEPTELVLGVSLNGESRAYSTAHLNRHEIVNDTVGGRKIAVTW